MCARTTAAADLVQAPRLVERSRCRPALSARGLHTAPRSRGSRNAGGRGCRAICGCTQHTDAQAIPQKPGRRQRVPRCCHGENGSGTAALRTQWNKYPDGDSPFSPAPQSRTGQCTHSHKYGQYAHTKHNNQALSHHYNIHTSITQKCTQQKTNQPTHTVTGAHLILRNLRERLRVFGPKVVVHEHDVLAG